MRMVVPGKPRTAFTMVRGFFAPWRPSPPCGFRPAPWGFRPRSTTRGPAWRREPPTWPSPSARGN